jgi:hypothetical protein
MIALDPTRLPPDLFNRIRQKQIFVVTADPRAVQAATQ